jgi:FAD binding domain
MLAGCFVLGCQFSQTNVENAVRFRVTLFLPSFTTENFPGPLDRPRLLVDPPIESRHPPGVPRLRRSHPTLQRRGYYAAYLHTVNLGSIMSVPVGANMETGIASLTSKLKETLSSSSHTESAADTVPTNGHTFKSADGSLPSNHRSANRVLPPNVSEADFDAALKEFGEIVGATHVETVDLDTLMDGDYMHQPKTHDTFYILDQKDLVASAVVRPGSTEEVQGLVRVANKYKIPIWITSIGRNFGYGGAARIPLLAWVDVSACSWIGVV